MQKEFQQGVAASSLQTFDLGRMTDLSLALLQDSGWYDVRYGSAGFSDHGYRAGCAWGRGNIAAVRADPQSERLVCDANLRSACNVDVCLTAANFAPATPDRYHACLAQLPAECTKCVADYSGAGMCYRTSLDGGFLFAKPARFTLFAAFCVCVIAWHMQECVLYAALLCVCSSCRLALPGNRKGRAASTCSCDAPCIIMPHRSSTRATDPGHLTTCISVLYIYI